MTSYVTSPKFVVYGQRRAFNKSFPTGKHDTASQLLKEFVHRNWSRRWLNQFREKIDKFGSVWQDVAQLDNAAIFGGVAWSRYLSSALRPAVHIINIDFDLN